MGVNFVTHAASVRVWTPPKKSTNGAEGLLAKNQLAVACDAQTVGLACVADDDFAVTLHKVLGIDLAELGANLRGRWRG